MPIMAAPPAPPAATSSAPVTAAVGPIIDAKWRALAVPYSRISSYYPEEPLERGIDGVALVECRASKQGALVDCKVLREAPSGYGFGASALALAAQFRMERSTISGAAVEGRAVRMPFRFRLPWSPSDVSEQQGAFTISAPLLYLKAPSGSDFARLFPSQAARQQIEGLATIRCRVTTEGAMGDCKVVAEEPSGQHFGDAALRLANLFRVNLTKGAGLVAAGKDLTIPIKFALPH